MAKVASTRHLTRHGDVWYHRRRVPDDLVSAIQRREVEDLEWSARLAPCATASASSDSPLSKSALVDLVRSHVEEVVGRLEARYAADPLESEAQKGEMRADIEIGRRVLQDAHHREGR